MLLIGKHCLKEEPSNSFGICFYLFGHKDIQLDNYTKYYKGGQFGKVFKIKDFNNNGKHWFNTGVL